ncbi:class I SAM-dependent methyltransferase [Mycobacterium sp. M1]|uniref:Class I SAM-dependent methyltransferase n=1 Tax=Mycolicibacter acidiphilus TaxID=2835306 RepID=A0ABS5RJ45_9MYCO|nr:class I SAM-dependent methyltransferase [Mycolicibacter acidiphilus]MBS9534322.1 class I SAM-dependent methyltransferase [Mycolicibacter acidiphilus]
MSISITDFTPLEQTALLTEYARALDSRDAHSILHDTLADEVVGQIDYDFAGFRIPANVVRQTALRAKLLDTRVAKFIAQHPDAVVVDLGAGLGTPRQRVAPPAGVDWYSIDLPRVITLRTRLVQPAAGDHPVAADLTGGEWVDAVPAGRPTIVIADGLFAFLSEQQVIELLGRVIDRFGSGQLAFNDYGRIGLLSRLSMKLAPRGMFRMLNQVWANPGFSDPQTPQRWEPRLRLVEQACLAHAAEVDDFPGAARRLTKLSGKVKSIAQRARVLRYRF